MINTHNKLIREVLPKIGSDAFTILLFIASHLGKENKAWPGIKRIREHCTTLGPDGVVMWMSKQRVYRALNRLEEEKLLSRSQERGGGKFGKTIYRVTTKHIGIWNGADQFFLEETNAHQDIRIPESPHAVKPEHGLPEHGKPESDIAAHLSIDNKEVIDNIEVIGEREETRAQEEKNETPKQPADLPRPSANQPALELDYQPAFDFLFAYLKTNPEMCRTRVERAKFAGASITSREALEGYLNKLNREKRFFDLTIPQDEGRQFQWIAGHLAGWESYMRSWRSNERKNGATATPPHVSADIRLRPQRQPDPDAGNKVRILRELGYTNEEITRQGYEVA